jgi:hypothetical protein
MMEENPLRELLNDRLPEFDFGVMSHGFVEHGRDYRFIIEIGRDDPYELLFTHVVNVTYATALSPAGWRQSWGDEFTEYQRWEAAGEPNGYVFGTNWSLAYPGVSILEKHKDAVGWAKTIGLPMYAARIETDRFSIVLVYGGVEMKQLSSDFSTVNKVLIQLPPDRSEDSKK